MTTIEWTDETLNLTVGCSRVSEGCTRCYAMGLAHRGMQDAHRGLTVMTDHGVDWTGEVRLVPERLEVPFRWRRPRRVFLDSMSDIWHPKVPKDFLAEVFAVAALTPRHTWQVLTKRPKRMAAVLGNEAFAALVEEAILRRHPRAPLTDDGDGYLMPGAWDHDGMTWPLPNVWAGASIELDEFAWRADAVRATPARVRWLSIEPLLGPVPLLDLSGIDLVVIGGESGSGARPMDLAWVEDAMAAAREAGTKVFVKQLGSALSKRLGLAHSKGGDITEWPEWLRVREMPA